MHHAANTAFRLAPGCSFSALPSRNKNLGLTTVEIAGGEGFVLLPQRLGDLAEGVAREQAASPLPKFGTLVQKCCIFSTGS